MQKGKAQSYDLLERCHQTLRSRCGSTDALLINLKIILES